MNIVNETLTEFFENRIKTSEVMMNVIGYSVLAIGVGLPQFKTEEEAQEYAKTCNGIVIPIVDVEILKEVK